MNSHTLANLSYSTFEKMYKRNYTYRICIALYQAVSNLSAVDKKRLKKQMTPVPKSVALMHGAYLPSGGSLRSCHQTHHYDDALKSWVWQPHLQVTATFAWRLNHFQQASLFHTCSINLYLTITKNSEYITCSGNCISSRWIILEIARTLE